MEDRYGIMKITLMHNPSAGSDDRPKAEQLVEALEKAGHRVTYQSTHQSGAKWALLDPGDLVLAAGGDGTVRQIALALFGRSAPLSILPLGTANNMAKTFGIVGSIPEIISGLENPSRAYLDVGLAVGPWGKKPFVESAGAGVLARTMSYMTAHEDEGCTAPLKESRQILRKFLKDYPSRKWKITLDGKSIDGKFLLVEVMNMRLAGPNLHLAPDVETGDSCFDFVFLKEEQREAFLEYLEKSETEEDLEAPVEIVRGKTLQLQDVQTEPIHVDDFTWPEEEDQKSDRHARQPLNIRFSVIGKPLEILVPRSET